MSRHSWADLFERAAAHEVGVDAVRDALAAWRADQDGMADRSADSGREETADGRNSNRDRNGTTGATGATDRNANPDRNERRAGAGEDDRSRRAARVVADADVLAVDLLVGGDAGPPTDRPDSGDSPDSGNPPEPDDAPDADDRPDAATPSREATTPTREPTTPTREAMDLVRAHSWLTLVASEPLLDDAETVVAEMADPDLAADWRATAGDLATVVDHPVGDHPALASALHGDAAHLLSHDDALLGPEAGAALRGRLETSVRRPSAFVRVFDAAALHEAVVGGDYPGPDRDPRG